MVAGVAVAAYGISSTNSYAPAPPTGDGTVTGGIVPCSGLPITGGPRYSAGTVTVLKGEIVWPHTGVDPLVPVFPTTVVARATVTTDAIYWFALEPGHYILEARYAAPSNVIPWTEFTVHAGDELSVDIPNMCM